MSPERVSHIFGYPIRLNACVDGRWVDATAALTMTDGPARILFDEGKFLTAVDESEKRRDAWNQVGLPE